MREPQVVIPVKAFAAAKARLADRLDSDRRATLARLMAEHVISAAAGLDRLVVCDDDDVDAWATALGVTVHRSDGLDLNASVRSAFDHARDAGSSRVLVVHADLPFACDLDRLVDVAAVEAVLAPDRHSDGSNCLSVPTDVDFRFQYGPSSAAAHTAEAHRVGLVVRTIDDARLAWDVDVPADLDPPPELGTLPHLQIDAST